MAKLGFTKLGLKPNNEITQIEFNEQIIEIKHYLPVEEKLEIIGNVLTLSHDQNNFSNPVKIEVYSFLEICKKYTNINFTEKQLENPTKLYDLMMGNGLVQTITHTIPKTEYETVIKGIKDTIDAIYTYQNSAMGILEGITQDYGALELDATELQKKIADPNSLELLKSIMTKLG